MTGFKHIKEAATEAYNYVEGVRSGRIKFLNSKYKKMDKTVGKLQWGDIMLIAGMSGSGKTLFSQDYVLSLMEENPEQPFDILSFNYEMTAARLVVRKFSSEFNISIKDLLNDETPTLTDVEMAKIKRYSSEVLSNYPMFFAETPKSSAEFADMIHRHYKEFKKPMIVEVDHVGLSKRSASETSTTEMIYNLGIAQSAIKKELPVIFVNISQLNREIEDTTRKTFGSVLNYPCKGDISYGDGLYHHADYVIINHRPAQLNLLKYGPTKVEVTPNDIYHHVLKNRSGETCILKYTANFKYMKLDETNFQE